MVEVASLSAYGSPDLRAQPTKADHAVSAGCGRIKGGAPARGERIAKHSRLIEIETTTALLGSSEVIEIR